MDRRRRRTILKRGEAWTAASGPDYAGKPRPVLIIQDDAFAETDSITVCPLTTHMADADTFRPALVPSSANGLRHPSYAMADKITTVPRAKLGQRIGKIEDADMLRVNRAMLLFLGLAGRARPR